MILAGQPAAEPARAHYLDGMRGWAAVMVVLYHLLVEALGSVLPALRSSVIKPFFDGELAVSLFFVLSGTALSAPYFRRREFGDLLPVILVRYFRLTIPILMSCLLVYAVMKIGWIFNGQAGEILHRPDWLGSWLRFEPNAARMARFALIDVFGFVDGSASYNPFLWTMSLEMFGSLLVFVLCAAHPYVGQSLRLHWWAAGFLLLMGAYVGLFIVGFCMGASMHARTALARRPQGMAAAAYLPHAAIVVLVVLIQCISGHARHVLEMIEAVLICQVVYASAFWRGALSGPLSRWLGTVSFAVYWVQFPVIVSLFSYGVVRMHEQGLLTLPCGLALGGLTFVFILIAAAVGTRIEQYLLRAVKVRMKPWTALSA